MVTHVEAICCRMIPDRTRSQDDLVYVYLLWLADRKDNYFVRTIRPVAQFHKTARPEGAGRAPVSRRFDEARFGVDETRELSQ